MATPDITVVGAGIFGLSIAFRAARGGACVCVVETKGVGAGASGGVVGALAPHTPENWNPKKQFQFESLIAAKPFWADAEAVSGLSSGYARFGRIQALPNDRAVELAEARIEGAKLHWGQAAEWRVADSPGSWAPESATGLYVIDTLSARIHPKEACDCLAAGLRKLSVEVQPTLPETTGPIVWATGVDGLGVLSKELDRPVGNGVKGQALVLGLDRSDKPQIFADGVHIVPHANGTVAIGSTSEREYDDPTSTDAQLDALHERAVALCPDLTDAPLVQRWAGVRPRTKSRAPMLGAWPGRAGHYVANGGFKIGFGMAPKVADVMVDFVLDGKDAIPDGFRVEDNL